MLSDRHEDDDCDGHRVPLAAGLELSDATRDVLGAALVLSDGLGVSLWEAIDESEDDALLLARAVEVCERLPDALPERQREGELVALARGEPLGLRDADGDLLALGLTLLEGLTDSDPTCDKDADTLQLIEGDAVDDTDSEGDCEPPGLRDWDRDEELLGVRDGDLDALRERDGDAVPEPELDVLRLIEGSAVGDCVRLTVVLVRDERVALNEDDGDLAGDAERRFVPVKVGDTETEKLRDVLAPPDGDAASDLDKAFEGLVLLEALCDCDGCALAEEDTSALGEGSDTVAAHVGVACSVPE